MSTVTENRHVIQKTIFDIRFDSEEAAFEQHTALDELVRRRLLKVVEEAFDETVDAEQVLVLSSLEVDLGVVSYADYSREMEDRLRHRLRELLRAQYARAQSRSARDSTLVGRSSAEVAQLSHYLTHGHLPWNADDQGPQAIERLLNRVMLHDPNGLARLLRDPARREATIRRLVTQLPAEYLAAILKTLLPSAWSGRLAALADDLAALPGAAPLPAPPFANEVMESVWSSLFRHALSAEAPAQGPEDLLSRALADLPANMKLMGAPAWRALIAGLTRATTLDRGEPDKAVSPHLLRERDGFDDVVEPASVSSRSLEQPRSRNGTPRASTHGDDRQDPVFPETAMPAGVKRFSVEDIASEAATASLRPEAPEGSHEAAADGVDGPDAIYVSRELRSPNVTAEAAGGGRQDYAELPPGLLAATARASSSTVENGVTPPLADTRVEVGNEDRLSFSSSGATGSDGARFHDNAARTDAAFEAGPEADLTDEYTATGELMRRALQIYDDIMAKVYGVRGGAGSRGDMSREIDELLRDSPSVLLRLYRELQSDAVLGHKLIDALSVEELRNLVFAFIAIGQQAGGGGEASELVRAIKAYSGIAAAPAGFYAHVLECLLTETVVDLEAFASSNDEFEKKDRPSAPRSDPREQGGRSLPHAGEPEGGVTDSAFDDARPRAHAQTFSRLSARTDVVRPDLAHAASVYPFGTDDRYPPSGAAGPRADQARGNFAATASFNHRKDNSTPDVSDTAGSDDSRLPRAGEVSISKGIIFDDARREGRYTPYRERPDSLPRPKLPADLRAADANGYRTTGKTAVDEALAYAMDGAQAEKMPAIAEDGGCSERALIILPGDHDLILTNVGGLLLSDIFIYKTWPAPLAPELLPAFFHADLSLIAVDDALEISETGASASEAGEHPPGPQKSRFYYNEGHSPASSPLDATPQSRSSWQRNMFRETSGKRLVCLLDDLVDDGLGFLFGPSSPRVIGRGSYASSNMSDSPHPALRAAAGTFGDASWRMQLYSSRVLHGEKEILPARRLRQKSFKSPLMRDGLYGRRYKDVPHPRSPMRQAWQPAPRKMAGHASAFDSFECTLHRIGFASAKDSSRYIGAVAANVHDPKMGLVALYGWGSSLYPVTDLFSLHSSRHERCDNEPPDSTVVGGESGLPPQGGSDDRRDARQAREASPRTPIAGRSTDTAHVPYSGLGMYTHSRSWSQETVSVTRHPFADERDSVLTASGFVNSETEESRADKDEADAGLVPPPDTRFSTPPNWTGRDSTDEHRRVGRQGAVPMLADSPSAPSWQQDYNADLHVAHRPATLAERGENGGEPAMIERGAMPESDVSARVERGAAPASSPARIHADYEYARTLLTQGRRPSPDETGWLAGFVEVLSSSRPDRLRQLLEDRAARRGFLEYWADSLSERPSLRILQLLRPGGHHLLLQTCDIIAQACYRNDGAGGARRINRLKWRYIFQFVLEERRAFELASIARRLADHLQEHTGSKGNRSFRSELCQRIAMNILPSTRALSLRIIAALAAEGATSDADAVLARPLPLAHGGRSDHEALGKIYIANAGLVLIASYLPRLFEAFGLTEIAAFTSPRAAEGAVRLIQFMVDERTEVGEHQLVLNKLLCGVELAAPVAKDVELSSRERELMESLLRAVIANWKGIGNTSVAGLRVSFLQRQGVLHFKGEAWHLQVENKAYDMLLDSLPWSYSIIKLPWMEKMLNVDWR